MVKSFSVDFSAYPLYRPIGIHGRELIRQLGILDLYAILTDLGFSDIVPEMGYVSFFPGKDIAGLVSNIEGLMLFIHSDAKIVLKSLNERNDKVLVTVSY